MYKSLIRPVLFSLDPEHAHHLTMRMGNFANKMGLIPFVDKLYKKEDSRLQQKIFGLNFKNPVGLAAGSDKNCEAQEMMAAFGFGFLESVSFTFQAQDGNPRPRMFRFPADNAVINRLGFPTIGAEALVPKIIEAKRNVQKVSGAIFGVNFGKSKVVALEDAVNDYLNSFRLMKDIADYIVINVSSPNTPGLRTLQEGTRLNEILSSLQKENTKHIPLLVKVAPDLTFPELDEAIEAAVNNNLQGIVATNTTKSREGLSSTPNQEGGMSGKPLFPKSIEFVRYIRKQLQGKLKIIGVGGISSAADAIEMFRSGADLIELYTGLIYQGPRVAYDIKCGLLKYMDQNDCKSISEVVGSGNQ